MRPATSVLLTFYEFLCDRWYSRMHLYIAFQENGVLLDVTREVSWGGNVLV